MLKISAIYFMWNPEICQDPLNRLPTISRNISARVISVRMFHHGNISARAPFGPTDVPADGQFNTGTFWHGDFSARGLFGTRNFWHHGHFGTGYFGTWTFWPMDILAPCKAIWMFWQRHFGTCATVPKYPRVEMFLCRKFFMPKIPCAEKSPCRNVSVLKRPSAGTSAAPNGALAPNLPKCSRDETSVPKWLLPKCSGPKWWVGLNQAYQGQDDLVLSAHQKNQIVIILWEWYCSLPPSRCNQFRQFGVWTIKVSYFNPLSELT